MSYRAVIVENPALISLRREQLIVQTDREHSLPVEDLNALLLEDRRSTVTVAALSRLGQSGCAVFVCDEKHMPCAVLTPFSQHSRALAVARAQLDASEPLKKRLWQSLVRAKIANQAACLRWAGNGQAADALDAMAARVRSGDPDNLEASAAQRYFPALFGEDFTRREEDDCNAALNYGYAILRGCVARYLAVYGLLPAFGLHHCSTLNGFNLADDCMEPFRPVADMMVSACFVPGEGLTPVAKRQLLNCLNADILSGGEHHSVSYAMERLVQSLSLSFREKKAALCLPELRELTQHSYE